MRPASRSAPQHLLGQWLWVPGIRHHALDLQALAGFPGKHPKPWSLLESCRTQLRCGKSALSTPRGHKINMVLGKTIIVVSFMCHELTNFRDVISWSLVDLRVRKPSWHSDSRFPSDLAPSPSPPSPSPQPLPTPSVSAGLSAQDPAGVKGFFPLMCWPRAPRAPHVGAWLFLAG